MINILRIIQFLIFIVLALPAVAFGYFTDVLVSLIVKYQTRCRICKDCGREFYE